MFVWRKEYVNQKPEAFSDRVSLLKRNQRIVKAMLFSIIVSLVSSICLWVGFVVTLAENNLSTTLCLSILGGALFLAGLCLLYLAGNILRSKK